MPEENQRATQPSPQTADTPSPTVAPQISTVPPQPNTPAAPANTPPDTQQAAQNSVYPSPAQDTQGMIGLSASQMGFNKRSSGFRFNVKKFFIGSILALVIIGSVLAALFFANLLPSGQLKTTRYTNANNVSFNLKFYSKYRTTKLETGNNQLVSEVSKDDKFPITLSISTGSAGAAQRLKTCTGFEKEVDIKNEFIGQTISLCDLLDGTKTGGKDSNDSVYLAVFTVDNKTHIVTIGQDYSQAKLGSPSEAQESLTKFGLSPYKSDIEKIIASIEVVK